MISPINLLGNICIFLSVAASILGIVAALKNQKKIWQGVAYFNFIAMSIAIVAMVYALLTNDFSVSYVAHVGAKETPRFFAAISLWSSLEGSILLWGWVLSAYTALCIYRYRKETPFSSPAMMPWVALTLFCVGVFFYLVLTFPANPFHTVFPIPENGPGPNPLLQNHWLMALHPPMLYLGYVGMSVPFAFAVAAMILGDSNQTWIRTTRYWTLTAWVFLSSAIILGGWWSYAVLGWGGYWAWDPVENASFMPWLTATAFLHSVMVEERRGMLKIWNLALICATFLLTILGTFLTRSGILDSVHAFTESGIGHYFLIAIAIALGVAVALLIWKAPRFKSVGRLDHPFSRESLFLLNNLLFLCFCFVVLLGTLYPLLIEAIQGIKITVGEPFFNQMTTPLVLLILLLMGIGVAVPWKKPDFKTLRKTLVLPSLCALGVLLIAFFAGVKKILVLAALALAMFSFAIMMIEMIVASRLSKSFFKIFANNPRRYGGFVVHMGIILIAVGVAFSKNYQVEHQFRFKPGEIFSMDPYTLRLERLYGNPKAQRFEVIADVAILKNGRPIGWLSPKLNFYSNNREPIGSPDVRSTIKEDLYLTLMAFEHNQFEATIRALKTPAVSWIWGGGGVIILGVILATRRKT